MRPIAKHPLSVSIVIKKEESPIEVPLHTSEDEEIKREERSPLPSLQYPSTSSSSRPSSRLSSYCTRSPPHCFSPYQRGDSSDSTYHPASIIRSPTPLAQPIDWRPVFNHGAATDTTLVPSSSSAETRVGLIDNALCQIFLPAEVENLIREGIQLGIQQRAEEERRQHIWQRVLEARARIEERLDREERVLPGHPPFPKLVPCCWFRGTPSLLLDLENFLGYLHVTAKTTFVTTRIVPSLRIVPRFEAPIHVPRPHNPSPRPPPPYIQGPRVILEDETDESLSS